MLGPIDVLVNSAGAFPRISWDDMSEPAWADAIEVNLTIHYHRLIRAAVPSMIRNSFGRIVNIGSVTSHSGRSGLAAYHAAEGGLVGLTRSLARELGPTASP